MIPLTRAVTLALFGVLTAAPTLAQHQGHAHPRDAKGEMIHDEVTMPGLQGEDASVMESAEIERMFRDFTSLSREVDLLPDGIRTVTRSSDPQTMDALVSHVVGMIARVEEGRDPKIFIQSPTLDILFERREAIVTEIDVTDAGIVVTQTTEDADVVAALHTHAGEVSDMATRGMVSVHERMRGQ